MQVDKYTYEVCPFDKASQKEGGSATSLGSWSGFEAGETKLAFKNGATCWQGPSRSMTVRWVAWAASHTGCFVGPGGRVC